ncbi:MAG: class I SAM-dependent methyltransferase [Anaerolineae bacterium]|nr:class I SAM-dependent methyltransferase [Anaerolineae bacterium]
MVDYDIYEEFRDPETYDLICDAFDEDYPVIEQWARTLGSPLLDLACGTGRMAIHMALQGYQVTGVDLMSEMIARARQKAAERAVSVEWVAADARSFHLHQQFPFIFMLMNAFQFLLTREDHEAMFACVREHLLPGGYFLFETRNPSPHNLFEPHHPEGGHYRLPGGGELVTTEQQLYDPLTQIQHFTSHQTFFYSGGQRQEKTLRVALRYVFPQEMETLLFYNGFQIHTCYGNWQQDPLTATSPAMIYVCQKRA